MYLSRISKLVDRGGGSQRLWLAAITVHPFQDFSRGIEPRLEYLFRASRLDPKFKPSRYHVLLAARLLANRSLMPKMNARDMEKYCKVITDILWDADGADGLLATAARAVETVAGGDLSGDNVRTQKFTEDLVKHLAPVP
jgi:hypothetical protein